MVSALVQEGSVKFFAVQLLLHPHLDRVSWVWSGIISIFLWSSGVKFNQEDLKSTFSEAVCFFSLVSCFYSNLWLSASPSSLAYYHPASFCAPFVSFSAPFLLPITTILRRIISFLPTGPRLSSATSVRTPWGIFCCCCSAKCALTSKNHPVESRCQSSSVFLMLWSLLIVILFRMYFFKFTFLHQIFQTLT